MQNRNIYIAVGNDVIDTFDDTVHCTERTHADAHITCCILNLEIALAAWRAAKEQRKGRASQHAAIEKMSATEALDYAASILNS
jgi:hypothetical protein